MVQWCLSVRLCVFCIFTYAFTDCIETWIEIEFLQILLHFTNFCKSYAPLCDIWFTMQVVKLGPYKISVFLVIEEMHTEGLMQFCEPHLVYNLPRTGDIFCLHL